MENTYQYNPVRPTPLTVFIVLTILLNALTMLKALNVGIEFVAAIFVCLQVYGLLKLWKLEELGVYLWFIPQCIVLIQLARSPAALPFIIEAVFTVAFIYSVSLVWNSLWPLKINSKK